MGDMMDSDNPFLQFQSQADLDKIALLSQGKYIEVRFGYVVSLFFRNGETKEKRRDFMKIVRHYYEVFGPNVTHYQKLDASRLTRVKDAAFLDYYDAEAERLGPEDDFGADIYGYFDGIEKDEPSLYYIGGFTKPIDPNLSQISYFDAYIPASWVGMVGYHSFIALVRHWCEILNPDHGTAGLGTFFNQGDSRATSGLIAFPAIKRFPGLDYNDCVSWVTACKKAPQSVIRTTNWLNILNDSFIARLGGLEHIAKELGPDCPVLPYQGGAIIQAGPHPELGDVNRGMIPQHYRTVAHLLKPLVFKAYSKLGYLQAPDPLDPCEETLKWLDRFD